LSVWPKRRGSKGLSLSSFDTDIALMEVRRAARRLKQGKSISDDAVHAAQILFLEMTIKK
jgi:hypothetical protein